MNEKHSHWNAIFGQTLTFGAVGLGTMAVQLSSFFLLEHLLLVQYNFAATVSYILAVLIHFTLNRLVTFGATNGRIMSHLYRYLTVVAVNYAITLVVLNAAVRIFSLSPIAGLIASVGTTFLTGFLLMKGWVFRHET